MGKQEVTQLPEEMIQHIQSFLSEKETARTTHLSKSWYAAWLTHPNLDFSYLGHPTSTAFERFVKKTLQRYEELNRKIQSFMLRMVGRNLISTFMAKEFVVKAMKLGATDLDIHDLVLPREVLGYETLVRLSLLRGRIDLQIQQVRCSKLWTYCMDMEPPSAHRDTRCFGMD
ncbi:hypothetical protein ACS0TY_027544 [Phlomoides rotata]